MDMFRYKLHLKEIAEMKTIKARDKLMREMTSAIINDLVYTSSYTREININEKVLAYKLLVLVIKGNMGSTGIPEFVSNTIKNYEKYLLLFIIDSNKSYEYMCDVFEFTETISTTSLNYDKVKRLAVIVGSNPIPLDDINYYYTPQTPYSNLDANTVSKTHTFARTYEIEKMKLHLDPAVTYTVLEDLLRKEYTAIEKADYKVISSKMSELITRTKEMVVLNDIISKTLHKEVV